MPSDRLRAARQIARQGLSVRQAEALVERIRRESHREPGSQEREREAATAWPNLERRLRERLGAQVRVRGKAEKGKIEIRYVSAEELDRLLRALGLG